MLSKKLCIITGASQNHFKSLKQFLSTVDFEIFDCIIYDLGLFKESMIKLQVEFPAGVFKLFDFSKYPSYFNININAGEYAWKPTIINEVLNYIKTNHYPTEILLWCDAGNKILNKNLSTLISAVHKYYIYSPSSSGNIHTWTYPTTYEWFGIKADSSILKLPNRNGAILAFNIMNDDVCLFIEQFAQCAAIKECIAPEGSSRKNHRQDQAVFTLLYYMFYDKLSQTEYINHYLGISIHNDVD